MILRANKKAQALLELAIFGSLILLFFGILLSYMQRQNDQQYLQMEAFRRALQISNTGGATPADKTAGGAAAQLTVLENRRHVDLGNYFMKGSPQSLSASSNVFWAVPSVGADAERRVHVKVNDDYSPDLSAGEGVEDIDTASTSSFSEVISKQETPESITNIKSSVLKDTVTTTLLDKDKNKLWEVTQGVYRDSDGQYKYSKDKVDTEVKREQSWQTEFSK
jgi:uncharacterized protein (UPF0333 family)